MAIGTNRLVPVLRHPVRRGDSPLGVSQFEETRHIEPNTSSGSGGESQNLHSIVSVLELREALVVGSINRT